MKLLLKNATIVTKNQFDDVINKGWILIEDDFITQIQEFSPPRELEQQSDIVRDCKGHIVLPGFINAHTHFSQGLLRGSKRDISLEDWLNNIIRPHQQRITLPEMKLATEVSVAENLLCGVTTVVQHHKILNTVDYVFETISTVENSGIRSVFMIGCDDNILQKYSTPTYFDFVRALKKQYSNDMMAFGIAPKSLINTSINSLYSIAEACKSEKLFFHIHINENLNDRESVISKTKKKPIKLLDELGLISELSHLVHCVCIDDEEIEIVSSKLANIIHCPTSNLYLSCGVAPIDKLISKKINVCIGSDGTASGISQDILSNLKLSTLLFKNSSLPNYYTDLISHTFLNMVTTWGAKALGRTDIGQLRIGGKADLIAINVDKLSSQPFSDPQSAVVYTCSSEDIDLVIVNGQILSENRNLVYEDLSNLLTRVKLINKN